MSRYSRILKLKRKLFFTTQDVADAFGIRRESAWVLCSRYLKDGIFVRFKKDTYVLRQAWEEWDRLQFLKMANFLQVPSYVSFLTALSYYEATTQVQREVFESAALRRSKKIDCEGRQFNYYRIKKDYYSGFTKKGSFFIASKEKALIDALYLCSLGRYSLDFNAVSWKKFDKNEIGKIIRIYPKETKEYIKKICRI